MSQVQLTTPSYMQGLEKSPITGVIFINCHINAKKRLKLKYVRDINLSGLSIDGVKG